MTSSPLLVPPPPSCHRPQLHNLSTQGHQHVVKKLKRNTAEASHLWEQRQLEQEPQVQTQGIISGRRDLMIVLLLVLKVGSMTCTLAD